MKNPFSNLFGAQQPAPSSPAQQLAAAVEADDLPLVSDLLAQSAHPDELYQNWTATQRAAANGRKAILQALLAHGADVQQRNNSVGDSLLHLAANGMYPSVFALLQAAGLDVNVRNQFQHTPLFAAASLDDTSGTLELLLLGADPALRDTAGQTAAEVALARENDLYNPWSTEMARAILAGWDKDGQE